MTDFPTGLDRFRSLVLHNTALQRTLHHTDVEGFADAAIAAAAAGGITLTADDLRSALTPDPIGVSRWEAFPVERTEWPSGDWRPIRLATVDGRTCVNWAHFADADPHESFYEESIRRALAHPFNRIFRCRMPVSDFVSGARAALVAPPGGFIFHMSRCGSTLVSRMLAAVDRFRVVSEPAPVDEAVQWARTRPEAEPLLAAMVAAFGHRDGASGRHFLKLDSWHTLALPLFRRVFPTVPWVFVYRDPVEVLVSHMRQRGIQTVPGMMPHGLYGFDDWDDMSPEDYCARALNAICVAAMDALPLGQGRLVNYRDLPQAVSEVILPHFNVVCSVDESRAMADAARIDAKAPHQTFAGDTDTKQRDAPPAVRAAAEAHLGETYRRLEALRARMG